MQQSPDPIPTLLDQDILTRFAAARLDLDPELLQLAVTPLRGGLESAAVAHCVAHDARRASRQKPFGFVVKRLDGPQRREAAVYAALLASSSDTNAPALLGIEEVSPTVTYLYLAYVRPARAWPWTETALAGRVLESLANLHVHMPVAPFVAIEPTWDYEAELADSARATLEVFEAAVMHVDLAWLRWARGPLRRTCQALPAMRRVMLAAEPFGIGLVHGDVHSGNVVLDNHERVILFDWARARQGSPLEDVTSWLQSLGYWEPNAKRRHDTLLRAYLVARGMSPEITRSVRDTYWMAAASNVFAGALRYHLTVAAGGSSAPSRARADAARAARDHLRVIRRADAVWRR